MKKHIIHLFEAVNSSQPYVILFVFLWWCSCDDSYDDFQALIFRGDSMHMLLSYEASRHWLERDCRGQELKQSIGGHCALCSKVL
jgi:hypothetical protein